MRLGVNRNHPFWHGRFGRRAQRAQASERLKHVAEAVPSPAVSCKSEASGFDLGGVVWQLVVDVSHCRCCRLELTFDCRRSHRQGLADDDVGCLR
jgi:hypothetical protein